MSAPPKFATRGEAVAAFGRGECRRWVSVDGWQVDLMAPEPEREARPTPSGLSVSDALRPLELAWSGLTVEERRELVEIAREALALAAAGARRISVAAIFERRRAGGVGLNQSWRAACADWLCERHVALADLIERRKRRAP